jgi:hypothetical protein
MAIAIPKGKSSNVVYDIMKSTGVYKKNRHTGEYALELETETRSAYEHPKMKFWECKRDGSLRDHGVEYVMNGPLALDDLDSALEEFQDKTKALKFVKDSISTSDHVHINFLNDTFLTMANFITVYALVENLLVKYSGPDRLSNLFCLSFRDAEGNVSYIEQMLSNINRGLFTKMQLNPENVKYSALNCAPLTHLGTLEIRTFRGETDIKVIKKWVAIIDCLKKFARLSGMTPIKILDLYKKERGNIIKTIFGKLASEIDCPDREKLIQINLRYAARFATTSKDWENFGVMKMKPVYKEQLNSILNKLAMDKFSKEYERLQYAEQTVVDEMYQRANASVHIVEYDEDV